MTRLHLFLLLSLAGHLTCFASDESVAGNAELKKHHPPNPEQGGLRLEVNATLSDSLASDGKIWTWAGASLSIEIALHNISMAPITVPTSSYEEKPSIVTWPAWGEGIERIVFSIESPSFQGKPTAFIAARYCPVVLAPGEYALIMHHSSWIKDRKHADAIKEASVVFGVSSKFAGPADWWRGHLETYATIQRTNDPDKEIERAKVAEERYDAQKADEREPGYGKSNAAKIAALIASCDQADIRAEQARKEEAVIVHDAGWIRNVSEAIAGGTLPTSTVCFCIGWRTAYFSKNAHFVISVAAIHGQQLRIYWPGGGGDYHVDETHWNAAKKALEFPAGANPSSEPTPRDAAHSN